MQRVDGFVGDVLEASVTELFGSYGFACERATEAVAAPSESVELGSVVGFRGKGVRGGLAFVAPLELIARLLPVPPDSARGDLQLRDWSAEIANQLLGRMKNKLSSRALDFDVGTPVCFTGTSIKLVFLPDADGFSLEFVAANAPVRVHLDCTLSAAIHGGEVEPARIALEGDVLLF